MVNRSVNAAALALLITGWCSPLKAQATSVRYIPMDSWMAPYIEHLFQAGVLPSLDPLTRPFQRGQVAIAIEETEHLNMSDATRAVVAMLARELLQGEDGPRWEIEPEIGVAAASDASRWPTRPAGDTARVFPQAQLTGSLELPHVALVTSPFLDNRLKHDPLYAGKKDRLVAGRANPAYALASWPSAEVFFGIADRNWGPALMEGLLLSDAAYATEHLFVRIGPPSVRLELAATQLDTVVPWDGGPAPQRWLVAHRLVLRPSRRLALSFDESLIYAGPGLPWRYLNPLALGLLTFYDNGPKPNALLGFAADWRPGGALRFFGQLAIDDIQIDDDSAGDREPPAYAFTLGSAGSIGVGTVVWSAFYTRVSNLMYRTPANEEQYTSAGVGLARHFSDYDQLTGRLQTIAGPGALVGLDLTVIRQGDGDIRQRYPDIASFHDSLTFLTGTVERTLSAALHGEWSPRRQISLSARVGLARGAGVSRVIWRLGGAIRHRWSGLIPR